MKRIILILTLILWAGSLTAQLKGVIKLDSRDSIKTYSYGWTSPTKDSIIYSFPDIIDLGLQYNQVKKKSSLRQDLKARIPYLIPIGLLMFMFRDDLQEWSIKNDKLAHLFLSYGISKLCGWRFAAGFMLAIELTQIDVFGIPGRYGDTAADLFMDGCGILFSFKF